MIQKIIILHAALIATIFLFSCATLDLLKGKSESSESSESSKSPFAAIKKINTYDAPKDYTVAYSYRTDKPHDLAKKIPKQTDALRLSNPEQYIKNVVEMIDANAKDDFERVKIAHDVVALLVNYDAKNFWANTVPEQDFRNVLKTKLAVCEGYANTLKRFLDVMKIKNEKVSGFARGVGVSLLTENVAESNHAWNIVRINEEWYVIDCTWDSGHMVGKVSKQDYTTDWLFLKPEHFIFTHLPEYSKYQLLENPISDKDFLNLPDLRPKFFETLPEVALNFNKTNDVENSFELSYTQNERFSLDVNLYDSDGKEIKNSVLTTREKTTIQFPREGLYNIKIFYGASGAREFTSCGEFYVKASSKSQIQYPMIYKIADAELLTPLEMPLKVGKTYHFEIRAPKMKNAAIINGKTFTEMKNDGNGLFSIDYTIPKGTKQIKAACAQAAKRSYSILADFKCE